MCAGCVSGCTFESVRECVRKFDRRREGVCVCFQCVYIEYFQCDFHLLPVDPDVVEIIDRLPFSLSLAFFVCVCVCVCVCAEVMYLSFPFAFVLFFPCTVVCGVAQPL